MLLYAHSPETARFCPHRLYLEDLEWERGGGQTTRHALLAASVIQPETWGLLLSQ